MIMLCIVITGITYSVTSTETQALINLRVAWDTLFLGRCRCGEVAAKWREVKNKSECKNCPPGQKKGYCREVSVSGGSAVTVISV